MVCPRRCYQDLALHDCIIVNQYVTFLYKELDRIILLPTQQVRPVTVMWAGFLWTMVNCVDWVYFLAESKENLEIEQNLEICSTRNLLLGQRAWYFIL